MKKRKIQLKDLKNDHVKRHLLHFNPFLKNTFRKLKADELKNIKVLQELFGENETDLSKLTAVYKYQSYEV